MAQSQLPVAAHIIAFTPYFVRRVQILTNCFTYRDKLDLRRWRETAGLAGFDRLVIYDREDNDATEVGNFLCVYRRGEAWSRWSFARRGATIQAWCSKTWADQGAFDTLAQAFEAVLGMTGPIDTAADAAVMAGMTGGAIITELSQRLRSRAPSRFGSAA